MSWETPKTDWYGETDSGGNYTGDRFNAVDFNRIKNNLEYLAELAVVLFEEFSIVSVGDDKNQGDYFYADEINQLEENLNAINASSLQMSYGDTPTYQENGYTMDYNELNRLESAILDLYNRLTTAINGRRKFTWNFGMKGGEL